MKSPPDSRNSTPREVDLYIYNIFITRHEPTLMRIIHTKSQKDGRGNTLYTRTMMRTLDTREELRMMSAYREHNFTGPAFSRRTGKDVLQSAREKCVCRSGTPTYGVRFLTRASCSCDTAGSQVHPARTARSRSVLIQRPRYHSTAPARDTRSAARKMCSGDDAVVSSIDYSEQLVNSQAPLGLRN